MSAYNSASSQAPPTTSVSDFLKPASAPAQPTTSDAYSKLCKVVLKARQRNMFALAAVATVVALNVAVFDLRGFPIHPIAVAIYAPLAFLGTLPIFVLRKQTLTTALPATPTRFSQLSLLRQPTAAFTLVAYLLASVPLSLAYLWCAASVSPNARLGWVFSQQALATQVNERRIYLVLLHAAVGVYAAAEHLVTTKSRVDFDADTNAAIPQRLTAKATGQIKPVLRSTLIVNSTFFVLYNLLRRPVLRAFLKHFGGQWALPYLHTLLRHSAGTSPSLLLRALSSSLLLLATWEAAHAIFATYATHPLAVSHYAPKPNQALLAGLADGDAYFQAFALQELAALSLTSEERRRAIFGEIKKDPSKGGAWNDVSRACLRVVGEELRRCKGRGVVAEASGAGVAGGGAKVTTQQSTSGLGRARVMEGDIFQPTKKTLLDKFTAAATAAPSANPTGATTAISTALLGSTGSAAVARVPQIFQTSAAEGARAVANAASAVAPEAVKQVAAKVHTLEERLGQFAPGRVREVLFAERAEYVVGVSVARPREVVWAVQALSNLLCASLTEDPYGLASRDLPKVVEGLVLYLDALEDFERELRERAERQGDRKGEWLDEVEGVVGVVERAVREGVKAVVGEFGEYMGEFKFAPRVAEKVQVIVDWG